MPPPSVPGGGVGGQNVFGSTSGGSAGGAVPQGNTGGTTGQEGEGAPTPQEMMQELEDRADAFEAEVTRIRVELREAKQNLRNAIRRNETDAVEIARLNQKVVDLTTLLI